MENCVVIIDSFPKISVQVGAAAYLPSQAITHSKNRTMKTGHEYMRDIKQRHSLTGTGTK